MGEPTVADMMTRSVVTVVPDSPFKELVGTMIAHDLDALPVIDLAGRPAGVVEDVDVLTKIEFRGGADLPPLLAGGRCRVRWHKSSGLTAADIMTTPPATITGRNTLAAAVGKLATPGARRLSVVDHTGRLVGVVSRQEILRLSSTATPRSSPTSNARPH
jgi:CBS-domain-containing membrane protein